MKKKTLTVGRTTAAVVDYLLEIWGQIETKKYGNCNNWTQ